MKNIFLFSMPLMLLTACGTAGEKTELNLTYVKSPLNAPAIIAYQQDLFTQAFAEDGITVKWSEINSGTQQTEAMAAGSIDIATVLGNTSAVLAYANGADIKIAGMFGRAPKAYRLMSKNPLFKSIKDIKGKKIGGPKGTVLHQLLLTALQKEGLTIEDVQFVSMGIPEAISAMEGGTIDGALLGGAATLLAEKSGAHLVVDGENLIQGSTVIAVRGELLKKHPNIVDKYLSVHKQALAYMESNPKESLQITAESLGLSQQETASMLPWYDFSLEITQKDKNDLSEVQNFLIQSGLLENKKNLDGIYVQ